MSVRNRTRFLAFSFVFACAAFWAKAEDYPILGTWQISNAVIAPWVGDDADKASYEAAAKKRLNESVTFEPDAVISDDTVLGCAGASYERTLLPPEGLFQGSLPEPDQAQLARDLGFPGGEVSGFDVACTTGLFSYHFAANNVVMFALDNMIYTLTRVAR